MHIYFMCNTYIFFIYVQYTLYIYIYTYTYTQDRAKIGLYISWLKPCYNDA